MEDTELKAFKQFVEESTIQIGALTALVKALAMTLTAEQRNRAGRLLAASAAATGGPVKTRFQQELERMRQLLL